MNSVILAQPHEKLWDTCLAKSRARGVDLLAGQAVSDKIKQLCDCAGVETTATV